jgi:hypothetical protein
VTAEWQGPWWLAFTKEWPAMRVFSRVTTVEISSSKFSEKMVRHVARFERLEKLHVQTGAKAPHEIAEMTWPFKLKELRVNGRLVETPQPGANVDVLACK